MAVGEILMSGQWDSRWAVVVAEGPLLAPVAIVDGKVVGRGMPIGTWCHVRDLDPHEVPPEFHEYAAAGRRVTAALRAELTRK